MRLSISSQLKLSLPRHRTLGTEGDEHFLVFVMAVIAWASQQRCPRFLERRYHSPFIEWVRSSRRWT
jgi:hypothetical protein